jgi:hypothetical protein
MTYMRGLWPKPSPAVLPLGLAAGVSEVSRFSCMEFLGVIWGLRLRRTEPRTRNSAPVHVAFRTLQLRQRPDCIFSELHTQPTYSPVYASLCTSRYPTQNSGPNGSLLLSRRDSSSPASYRFSPAHCNLIIFSCVGVPRRHPLSGDFLGSRLGILAAHAVSASWFGRPADMAGGIDNQRLAALLQLFTIAHFSLMISDPL